MRHRRAFLLGLWTCCLAGCVTGEPLQSTSWLHSLQPFQGPTGPDVVLMETALLEGPIGDPFLNRGLWQLADDQVIPLEHKAVLDDNGFQVGQVGGVTPAGLQAMLTSERHCANPQRFQLHAGNSTRLPIGAPLAACRFQVHQEDRTVPVDLEQAEFTLVVVPSLTPDGRTRLQFTPTIEYGKASLLPHPTKDRSAWIFNKDRPREAFAAFSWDVTLAPNEYALVGGRFDRPDTLGHQCFIRGDESTPRQRLLVIRTARPAAGMPSDTTPNGSEDESSLGASPPLALQAAWTTARGKGR